MATFRKPRKAWSELTPGYQKRMKANGLTARNWSTAKGAELRKTARGHSKTPERPAQAARNPQRYPQYVEKRADEQRQLQARKERLFGDSVKYRPDRARAATITNPKTGRMPRSEYVQRFLRMSERDVLDIDWSDDEWGFLFYH